MLRASISGSAGSRQPHRAVRPGRALPRHSREARRHRPSRTRAEHLRVAPCDAPWNGPGARGAHREPRPTRFVAWTLRSFWPSALARDDGRTARRTHPSQPAEARTPYDECALPHHAAQEWMRERMHTSRSPHLLSLIHISEPTRQAEISYAV